MGEHKIPRVRPSEAIARMNLTVEASKVAEDVDADTRDFMENLGEVLKWLGYLEMEDARLSLKVVN